MNHFSRKCLLTAAALGLVFAMIPAGPAQAKSKVYNYGTETEYYKDDSGNWVQHSVSKYTYNKKGDILSRTDTYTYDNFEYDEKTDEYISTPVTSTYAVKYTYNKKGLESSFSTYDDGRLTNKTTNKYKGTKLKSSTTTEWEESGAKHTSRVTCTYKKGRLVKEKYYEDGKLTVTSRYSYKGKKLRKRVDKNKSGKTTYTETRTYKNGKLSKISGRDSGGYTYVYKYKKGVLTSYTSTTSDGTKEISTYKKGLLRTAVTKTADGETTTSTYTYNSHGDETRYESVSSDGRREVTESSYTYYNNKYIKERAYTITSTESDGSTSSSTYKTVYSDWKAY